MFLRLDVNLEAGNGRNIRRLGPDHFALDTVGESSSYANYFLFRVTHDSPRPVTCRVDVHVDPAMSYHEADRRTFALSRSPIWIGDGGDRWRRLDDDTRGDMVSHLTLRLQPGEVAHVSPNVTLGCERMSKQMRACADACPQAALHTIGRSVEGRPIELVSVGNPSRPRLLVIAGLHAIEFPGIWSAKGILEAACADDEPGRWLREHFVVDILPHANPDGTVHGRQRTNLRGVDVYRQCRPGQPDAPEVAAIWSWLRDHVPALYVNFHGWTACERGTEPFEGSIRPRTAWYEKHGLRSLIEACDATLHRVAYPVSRYERIEQFTDGYDDEDANLLNQLAGQYGTVGYTYEPNMRIGPDQCQRRGVSILMGMARTLHQAGCTRF